MVTPRDSTRILIKDIAATQRIDLAYHQNNISISWAVLNFIKSGKNRSMYKLVGFNKEWMQPTDLSATFTNLTPGEYKLFLKGANNDGIWTEPALYLVLVIHPPYWKTWWAYTIYLILILLIIYTVINFFYSRNRLKRELELEYAINAQQQELHQMKMDFFTHISHEIRTPLTLIVGPIEMLLNNTLSAATTRKMLTSIKSNSDRLLKLTNDLLAFHKVDAGFSQMNIEAVNMVEFCRTIFEKFIGEAVHKSISYSFKSEVSEVLIYLDKEQIEIVFSNLLSNALKFTAIGGNISMLVEQQYDRLLVHVLDNGKGIPPENQAKIFTSYYQVKMGDDKTVGSGIGLAFSKRLIEMHQGTISFTSGLNPENNRQETCFTVSFKFGKQHLEQYI